MRLGPSDAATDTGPPVREPRERPPHRIQRLLPAGLVGAGRRPTWQRTRLRRLISAGLVATAAWLAMSAFIPQPTPRGVPVVVVAQDLTAGHVLTRGDLAVSDWPSDLVPGRAEADPTTLVGRALGAGMSRGEAVTAARIRGPGLLTGTPAGLVAAHVRLTDPAMAAMAATGDRVDLISTSGAIVASEAVVLSVDFGSPQGGPAVSGWSASSGTGPSGGIIVAVTSDDALRLATGDPSGLSDLTFSLILRAPSA